MGGGGSWLGDPYVKPRVLKVSVMKSSSHWRHKYSQNCPNRPPICSVNTGILSKSALLIRPEFPPFDITVNSSVYIGFCLLWKPAEYRGPNGTFGTVQTGLIDFSSMFFNHWPTGRCLPVN